ncbi:FtsX-like permease family protein [Actinomyces gerencseriae]|uniref:FtsX-like permease family protein n=1 Tax=Actinomyces gerencseriae TaxID=52769 RepID=UPI00041DA907|nr:FtsX-like permease family protein [Actinomyces gerencseriae]
MTAFVWKDMRHHARQWLWSLLVTTTGGAFIGVIIVSWWSALQWSTAQSSSSEYIGLTHILGSNLITYSGLSVAVVISTTLALTVAAQARSHALWKIIGIPSRRIRRIILAQIGVVGLLGGLIGALLSAPVTRWYLLTWRELELYPADMPVIMPVFAPPLTIGLTTAFSLLGGLGAARRAASTPEMQALREAVAPAARTRVWQWVVAGVLLLGVVAVAVITLVDPNVLAATGALDPETATEMAAHRAEDPGTLGGSMVLLGMIAVLCIPNWTIRPLLTGWTSLIPGRSPAWFAARANARHRSTMSLTTIVPFGIAVGMTGVVYSIVGTARATGTTDAVNGFLAIAVPIFIISGAGGVANIAMVGSTRRQENALLGVIGARRSTLMATTILEGAIYATTGILFGSAVTVLSAASAALFSSGGMRVLIAGLPLGILAPVVVVVLVLAVATTWLPALLDRRPMMDRLRQPA